MQSFSSRIWIRVAVSIFYDDNYYITGTSTKGKEGTRSLGLLPGLLRPTVVARDRVLSMAQKEQTIRENK